MMTFIKFCSEGLTTFTPGKISSKFTDRFEMKDQSGSKCKWQMAKYILIFLKDFTCCRWNSGQTPQKEIN